jgi:hypothetical protein
MHNIHGAFGFKYDQDMMHIHAIDCTYTNVRHAICSPCILCCLARRFAPYWPSIHAFANILCMKNALCVSRNSYIYDQDTMHILVFSSSYKQPGLSMCILNTMVWHKPLSGAIFTCYLDTNGSLIFLVVLVRFGASISTKIQTISTNYLHIACI